VIFAFLQNIRAAPQSMLTALQHYPHTLGEEESADFLLTAISEPIIQQLSLDDAGATVNLETVGENAHKKSPTNGKKAAAKAGKSTEEAGARR
jgi:hypothetical protein